MYGENVIVIRICANWFKRWFRYQWQRTLWTFCCEKGWFVERWKAVVENDEKYFD